MARPVLALMAERLPRGFGERLERRARRAGVDLPEPVRNGLMAYYELLLRWNRRVNLTAIVDPDEAIDRLLLEPIAAARHFPEWASVVMDVGSGGGSPAIPIKLARPAVRLIMVESKTRKAAFLREAVRVLRLVDAQVEGSRYEELLARPEFHEVADVLTLRAVRLEVRRLLELRAFVKPGGLLVLFQVGGGGRRWEVAPGLRLVGTFPLGVGAGSHVVLLEKLAGW